MCMSGRFPGRVLVSGSRTRRFCCQVTVSPRSKRESERASEREREREKHNVRAGRAEGPEGRMDDPYALQKERKRERAGRKSTTPKPFLSQSKEV